MLPCGTVTWWHTVNPGYLFSIAWLRKNRIDINSRENWAQFGCVCSGTFSDTEVVEKQLLTAKILNVKNGCMTIFHRRDLGNSATGYFCSIKENGTGWQRLMSKERKFRRARHKTFLLEVKKKCLWWEMNHRAQKKVAETSILVSLHNNC